MLQLYLYDCPLDILVSDIIEYNDLAVSPIILGKLLLITFITYFNENFIFTNIYMAYYSNFVIEIHHI